MIVDPHSLIQCGQSAIYFVVPFYVFLVTILCVPLLRIIAIKSNFVDKPDARKLHEGYVPPIGGLAIFLVFMAFLAFQGTTPFAMFLSLALILIVGLIDDSSGINAKLKFLLHFMAAIILVVGAGAQINTLGSVLGFGQLYLGIFSIPFSVACVVYILNAVNMMDGVDGLAGGNSFIIFGWLAAGALLAGRCDDALQILVLMAAIAGFLVFNMRSPFRKRANVFLGDTGSMALGLMIAWYAIHLSQSDHGVVAVKPISIAWIIALPIVDAFGLLVARLKDGKHPFAPDRRHFHHHFQNAGFGPRSTTRIILLWSLLLGAFGFIGVRTGVPEFVLGWSWIVLWIMHTILVIKSEIFIQILRDLRAKILNQSL